MAERAWWNSVAQLIVVREQREARNGPQVYLFMMHPYNPSTRPHLPITAPKYYSSQAVII